MRFRFTIRDLLWLTLVVGLVLALIYVRSSPVPGRYQMWSHPQVPSAPPMLFDTATGKLYSDNGSDWVPNHNAAEK